MPHQTGKSLPLAIQRRVLMLLSLVILLSAPVFSRSLVPDNTNERTLEPGQTLNGQLSGGDLHSFRVHLPARQYVNVVIDQDGIDVVCSVVAADGTEVADVDRPNGSHGPESISLITQTAGIHKITLRSLEKVAAPGRYRIRIALVRNPETADVERMRAERLVTEAERLRISFKAKSVDAAITKFKASLATWQKLADRYEQAVALYGLGWSYSLIGENQQSIAHFQRAYLIMNGLGDDYGKALNLSGLAWSLMYLGETNKSLDVFLATLALHRAQKNTRGEAIALYGIGWSYALLDENAKALDYFSRSLKLRREVKDLRGEALTLVGLGKIYNREGETAKALDHLSMAANLLHQLGNRHAEADVISNIGWVHVSNGQSEKALAYLHRALELRRVVGDRVGEATTLFGIARAEKARGNLTASASQIEQSVLIVESLRTKGANSTLRTSYFASVQEYYEFSIDVLMLLHKQDPSKNYAAKALEISERARGRSLLDLLVEAHVDARDAANSGLLELEREFNAQLKLHLVHPPQTNDGKLPTESLSSDKPGGQAAVERYDEIDNEISQGNLRLASLTQPTLLDADKIKQQTLDGQTIILEYFLGNENAYLWLVTEQRIEGFNLGSSKQLSSQARRSYELLTARNHHVENETPEQLHIRIAQADADYEAAAAILSEALLAPVKGELGDKRIIIVAHSGLHLIPFAALPDPNPESVPGQRVRYLIENHEIVRVPSISVLALLRKDLDGRQPAPKTIAILADPVFSLTDERLGFSRLNVPAKFCKVGTEVPLPRLFSTRWEATQIAALVPARDRFQALDFDANLTTALDPGLASFRIVHFATHAFFDDVNAEGSSIALSFFNRSGEPQNGRLGMREIFNLKLPAELVVLSACRTGLGKEVKGEGLMGITRGFMYAGARRVLVSVYSVNDKATAELMRRFYQRLLGKNRLSSAAALREAQIEMARHSRWRSPYFWSGFIIHGEPR